MRYKVIITYDKEYKGYYIEVPSLSGCMSQGKTIEEALKNVKDAIKGWLFTEKKHRRFIVQDSVEEVFIGEVTV